MKDSEKQSHTPTVLMGCSYLLSTIQPELPLSMNVRADFNDLWFILVALLFFFISQRLEIPNEIYEAAKSAIGTVIRTLMTALM